MANHLLRSTFRTHLVSLNLLPYFPILCTSYAEALRILLLSQFVRSQDLGCFLSPPKVVFIC